MQINAIQTNQMPILNSRPNNFNNLKLSDYRISLNSNISKGISFSGKNNVSLLQKVEQQPVCEVFSGFFEKGYDAKFTDDGGVLISVLKEENAKREGNLKFDKNGTLEQGILKIRNAKCDGITCPYEEAVVYITKGEFSNGFRADIQSTKIFNVDGKETIRVGGIYSLKFDEAGKLQRAGAKSLQEFLSTSNNLLKLEI